MCPIFCILSLVAVSVSDDTDSRGDNGNGFVDASANGACKNIVGQHKGCGYENALSNVLWVFERHTVGVDADSDHNEQRVPRLPRKSAHNYLN